MIKPVQTSKNVFEQFFSVKVTQQTSGLKGGNFSTWIALIKNRNKPGWKTPLD